jgi:hypothetical protein
MAEVPLETLSLFTTGESDRAKKKKKGSAKLVVPVAKRRPAFKLKGVPLAIAVIKLFKGLIIWLIHRLILRA